MVVRIAFKSIFGAEFVVPFFSGSRPLALKSSSKSHLMTIYFIQNDEIVAFMRTAWRDDTFRIDNSPHVSWPHQLTGARIHPTSDRPDDWLSMIELNECP